MSLKQFYRFHRNSMCELPLRDFGRWRAGTGTLPSQGLALQITNYTGHRADIFFFPEQKSRGLWQDILFPQCRRPQGKNNSLILPHILCGVSHLIKIGKKTSIHWIRVGCRASSMVDGYHWKALHFSLRSSVTFFPSSFFPFLASVYFPCNFFSPVTTRRFQNSVCLLWFIFQVHPHLTACPPQTSVAWVLWCLKQLHTLHRFGVEHALNGTGLICQARGMRWQVQILTQP